MSLEKVSAWLGLSRDKESPLTEEHVSHEVLSFAKKSARDCMWANGDAHSAEKEYEQNHPLSDEGRT
jgi:hypothetical protein